MKSEQIKHSLSVGIKSIQSRVFDRETDEVISFVKIPIADSGLVRCEWVDLTDEEIIESLAELEHEQWMKWAGTIMQTEKISDARLARWSECMIPYADLTEEMKEFDREWARKALAILRKAQEK